MVLLQRGEGRRGGRGEKGDRGEGIGGAGRGEGGRGGGGGRDQKVSGAGAVAQLIENLLNMHRVPSAFTGLGMVEHHGIPALGSASRKTRSSRLGCRDSSAVECELPLQRPCRVQSQHLWLLLPGL